MLPKLHDSVPSTQPSARDSRYKENSNQNYVGKLEASVAQQAIRGEGLLEAVRMRTSPGRLMEQQIVLRQVPKRSVFSWQNVFFFFFKCLFLRQRQSVNREEAERERERERERDRILSRL